MTIGVATISFLSLHMLAPSPVNAVLGQKATPAAVKAWNREHGYDRPLGLQLVSYFGGLAHLRFGYSYKEGQSVSALFAENAGRSAYLNERESGIAILVEIPLGITQAVERTIPGNYRGELKHRL